MRRWRAMPATVRARAAAARAASRPPAAAGAGDGAGGGGGGAVVEPAAGGGVDAGVEAELALRLRRFPEHIPGDRIERRRELRVERGESREGKARGKAGGGGRGEEVAAVEIHGGASFLKEAAWA